ncbi:hypothetical protein CLV30_101536 [Haloactinopolyspora alba]|uniref:Nucleotidyltransferase n=1 Tax=Haloactinopolyspora alba TaxID=648780 RepID=A0A2P8EGH6_9ACTN|nr:nucleotidyltransferase domain-containing protein [Haloactinopolyspora alba]PSL08561.1 hypothetical protein CLV30_101536 [Haloactinopolyspora alba]
MSGGPPILAGTQVVLHGEPADGGGSSGRGVSGRVVRVTDAGYGVVLIDGRRVEAQPDQLTVVGAPPSRPVAEQVDDATLVTEHTIYAATVGSAAERADDEPAGSEVRGVYQAPTSAFWSLTKPPVHVAGPGRGWFSWEVERFCELALEANPGCLELLWSPRTVWVSEAGHELLDLRGAFLSQAVGSAYAAYVLTQFKKLAETEGQGGESQRRRQVTHLLRLLVDGISLLRTGDLIEVATEHRDGLEAVRSGVLAWDEVESWRLELQQKLEEAASSSFLPAHPDTARVSAWLGDLRRRGTSTVGSDRQDQPARRTA